MRWGICSEELCFGGKGLSAFFGLGKVSVLHPALSFHSATITPPPSPFPFSPGTSREAKGNNLSTCELLAASAGLHCGVTLGAGNEGPFPEVRRRPMGARVPRGPGLAGGKVQGPLFPYCFLRAPGCSALCCAQGGTPLRDGTGRWCSEAQRCAPPFKSNCCLANGPLSSHSLLLHYAEIGPFKWGIGKLVANSEQLPIIVPYYHTGMEQVMPQDHNNQLIGIGFPKVGKHVTIKVNCQPKDLVAWPIIWSAATDWRPGGLPRPGG